MNRSRPFTSVAAAIFGLMALGHAYRLLAQVEVTIGAQVLPPWVSVVGLVVTGGLAVLLLREARAR